MIDPDLPKRLRATLAKMHDKLDAIAATRAPHAMSEAEANTAADRALAPVVIDAVLVGRDLIDLREQVGAVAFEKWLNAHLSFLPRARVEEFMDVALHSDLSRRITNAEIEAL